MTRLKGESDDCEEIVMCITIGKTDIHLKKDKYDIRLWYYYYEDEVDDDDDDDDDDDKDEDEVDDGEDDDELAWHWL